jgi:hypothetical protein
MASFVAQTMVLSASGATGLMRDFVQRFWVWFLLCAPGCAMAVPKFYLATGTTQVLVSKKPSITVIPQAMQLENGDFIVIRGRLLTEVTIEHGVNYLEASHYDLDGRKLGRVYFSTNRPSDAFGRTAVMGSLVSAVSPVKGQGGVGVAVIYSVRDITNERTRRGTVAFKGFHYVDGLVFSLNADGTPNEKFNGTGRVFVDYQTPILPPQFGTTKGRATYLGGVAVDGENRTYIAGIVEMFFSRFWNLRDLFNFESKDMQGDLFLKRSEENRRLWNRRPGGKVDMVLLARLTPQGQWDSSFGPWGNGFALIPHDRLKGELNSDVDALRITDEGKLIISGTTKAREGKMAFQYEVPEGARAGEPWIRRVLALPPVEGLENVHVFSSSDSQTFFSGVTGLRRNRGDFVLLPAGQEEADSGFAMPSSSLVTDRLFTPTLLAGGNTVLVPVYPEREGSLALVGIDLRTRDYQFRVPLEDQPNCGEHLKVWIAHRADQ